MITKTIALVFSISLTLFSGYTSVPLFVPVDISFCDLSSGDNESICNIRESEFGSRNKILLDQKGQAPKILIDKRNLMPEKAQYIFRDGHIIINERNVINIPYAELSILIRPGKYPVESTKQGYLILLDKRIIVNAGQELAVVD